MSHAGSRYNATMSSQSRGSIRGGMFAVASALSLLLCVMMVVARVAVPRLPRDMLTARKIDTLSDQSRVTYNYGLTGFGLSFNRDRELLPGMKASRKSLPDLDAYGFSFYSGPSVSTVFAVYSGRDVMYNEHHESFSLLIPYWAVALLALVLPLAYCPRRLRRLSGRRAGNICSACGYDLRATPDRCPECGKIPVKRRVAQMI